VARRAPEILQVSPDGLRIVSCHLGAGASLCAIRDGKSVDTTMGFTPLEGLVMATRSGTVDPGLLLWLLEQSDLSPSELAEALEHESGLLGLTGDADMRVVLARSNDGDARARLGVEVYIHRLRQEIASMAASMGGLDVLVFTGGVGERAPEIRRRAVAGLGFLGLTLDDAANARAGFDACVETSTSAASILVLQAREDLEIARQVESALTVA
jgi:acetate kinase